jgi:hypothetical protein
MVLRKELRRLSKKEIEEDRPLAEEVLKALHTPTTIRKQLLHFLLHKRMFTLLVTQSAFVTA